MLRSIRTLALVLTLTASLAPFARAGGAAIHVEQAKDGTYLVHTYACTGPSSVSVTASAEGMVHGVRKSIPLELKKTKEPGLYQFERPWPAGSTWLVRAELSGTHKVVNIATIASDGRVTGSEYVAAGDGRRECDQKLAANTK